MGKAKKIMKLFGTPAYISSQEKGRQGGQVTARRRWVEENVEEENEVMAREGSGERLGNKTALGFAPVWRHEKFALEFQPQREAVRCTAEGEQGRATCFHPLLTRYTHGGWTGLHEERWPAPGQFLSGATPCSAADESAPRACTLIDRDTGYYTEDGHLHVGGRIKDLIKCMDQQVAPAELEAILLSHPHVKEAVVAGVPHPDFGEAARAFIVLRNGQCGDRTARKRLQTFVSGMVAYHKQLHGGVEFLDELPATDTGKPLRRQLCEAYLKNSPSSLDD
ncbi:hypothetical protein HPB50_014757 [Hyalomma asiaticum]|uniref:Uncharacterized protein n=1 Tax=Hyalomma asiaticum TaxID=266040 RepID=A0ACB7TMY4_HYAAI|nr:hypothetical protein HPB50_014757 [Hyalomma asiaticum]